MTGIIRKLFAPVKFLSRNSGTGRLILMYHRVADLATDPQLLAASTTRFAAQMEHLAGHYPVVPLADILASPEGSVAITFDDGYRDNLDNALPILEKFNLPATVFVTSGETGSKRELWWDDLERILLLPADRPVALELKIGGKQHRWTFDERGAGSPSAVASWNVTREDDPTQYHAAYRQLHGLLKPLRTAERKSVLEDLYRWAGMPPEGRPDYRVMGREEIARLASSGLVGIGSHTVTHPMLSRLDATGQTKEIADSKKQLESLLGRPIDTISYPYGSRGDIARSTPRLAREAGYRLACANFTGRVSSGTDPYLLPRYIVRDWDGDEFARRLKGWFDEG